MKLNIVFSIFFAFAVFASTIDEVSAQKQIAGNEKNGSQLSPQAVSPIRVDDFAYAAGQLTDAGGGSNVGFGNWVSYSGSGNFIQVSSGSLTYPAYPSSGIGNKIEIISVGTSAEDVHRQFPTQGVGTTTYAAFMVNVANTTGLALNSSTTGDYFAGFLPGTSTTLLNARVSIRQGVAASTFNLGLRATSANAATSFGAADLTPGTTYLVVISYQVIAGNSNDVVKMWINPTLGGAEPMADLTQTTASTTDISEVSRFFVRQGTTATPNASIDGLRVGQSWASLIAAYLSPAPVDFNGDGKSDYAIVRNQSNQLVWYILENGSGAVSAFAWGLASSDRLVPADWDGDGKADIAIWREAPATEAAFYILQSGTNTLKISTFGQNGDDVSVVGDYDGDGKADAAAFRCPSGSPGQCSYYYRGSMDNPSGNITYVPWGFGSQYNVQPAAGDYDGDGKFDFCVRPNSMPPPVAAGGAVPAQFVLLRSSDAQTEWINWGLTSDFIVPRGDWDGDGKTDFAVARPSGTQFALYTLERDGGGTGSSPILFGDVDLDQGAFGDYDGDGKTDIGIWRESTGQYWIILSSSGALIGPQWGQAGDNAAAEWIFPRG